MPINVGDTVHSPAWDTFRGFSIDSYKVLQKNGGVLRLEHIATSYPGGKEVAGSMRTIERPENEFTQPLADRFKRIVGDANAIMAEFAKK
jgi:hypothetical protein